MGTEGSPTQQYLRQKASLEKESWDAFWRLRRMEAEGTFLPWARTRLQEAFDAPVTWFKETVVDPLHAKYKPVYYHRRISRVPDIDQCKVLDSKCMHEANFQFRLDRNVDMNILDILMERSQECTEYYANMLGAQSFAPCIPLLEDVEEAELNFFIKYGEIGTKGDARAVLAKQKHRMIWERRHPEIMAERERQFKEHKREVAMGKFDHSFWKEGGSKPWDHKEESGVPYEMFNDENPLYEGQISKDWQFYRDVKKEGTAANQEEKERKRFVSTTV